jgi:putative membrane protein
MGDHFYPDSGPEWLGMQGDLWDARADMLIAVLGGISAILLVGHIQDRQLCALVSGPQA